MCKVCKKIIRISKAKTESLRKITRGTSSMWESVSHFFVNLNYLLDNEILNFELSNIHIMWSSTASPSHTSCHIGIECILSKRGMGVSKVSCNWCVWYG